MVGMTEWGFLSINHWMSVFPIKQAHTETLIVSREVLFSKHQVKRLSKLASLIHKCNSNWWFYELLDAIIHLGCLDWIGVVIQDGAKYIVKDLPGVFKSIEFNEDSERHLM